MINQKEKQTRQLVVFLDRVESLAEAYRRSDPAFADRLMHDIWQPLEDLAREIDADRMAEEEKISDREGGHEDA